MEAISNLLGGSSERTMEASQVSTCALSNPRCLALRTIALELIYCRPVQEEMQNAKIPLGYRDYCAHLLVPLNACRRKELYLPWKCEHERHAYEKCEYLEYKRRLKNLKESEH